MDQAALESMIAFCDEMMITEESFTTVGDRIKESLGKLSENTKDLKARLMKIIMAIFDTFIAWLKEVSRRINGMKARTAVIEKVDKCLDKVFKDNAKIKMTGPVVPGEKNKELATYADTKAMQASMLKGEIGDIVRFIRKLLPTDQDFSSGVSTQKRILQIVRTFESDQKYLKSKVLPLVSDEDGNVDRKLDKIVTTITVALTDMQSLLNQLINMCYMEKSGTEINAPIVEFA